MYGYACRVLGSRFGIRGLQPCTSSCYMCFGGQRSVICVLKASSCVRACVFVFGYSRLLWGVLVFLLLVFPFESHDQACLRVF